MGRLFCLLADPSVGVFYQNGLLDEADRSRVAASPDLEGRADWRTSRFLKAEVLPPSRSLSHSRGYAAVLSGDADFCGVDVEFLRPRDFRGLAGWVCSREECVFLAGGGWQAEEFYRLWCVKEALLKAAGLEFPADMAKAGFVFDGGRVCGLRAGEDEAWHGVGALLDGRLALACVWKGEAVLAWRFYGVLTDGCLNGVRRY